MVIEHDAVCYVSTFALPLGKLDCGFIGCSFFISLEVLSWAPALLLLFFGSESQMLQVEHLTRGVTYFRCFVHFSFYPRLLLNLVLVVFLYLCFLTFVSLLGEVAKENVELLICVGMKYIFMCSLGFWGVLANFGFKLKLSILNYFYR